ncbi:MAG: phosphomannose isomerase type II C-terminal cupin domain [Candidatus Doudnabacteria bacterium]|nr:phosphomannose isomerase type II C-terminal cupin domain [Candidatus Doudnabacteria bacterium]
MNNHIENRPWGSYEILSEFSVNETGFTDSCIKKLVVKPLAKLSYQSHKLRNEHWFFVQGEGTVVLNGREMPVKVGSSVDIKIGDKHRIINTSKEKELIFIESQTGHYDENDIERFEDDYGRV